MKNKKLTIALTATGLASATLVSLFAINKVIGKIEEIKKYSTGDLEISAIA